MATKSSLHRLALQHGRRRAVGGREGLVRCPQAPQLIEGPRQIQIGLLAEREGAVVPGANAKLRGQRLGPGLRHAA